MKSPNGTIINLLSPKFKEYLEEHYVNGTKSIPTIAKEYNTYPNMIYRVMRKLGVERKTRSEAQRIALESGQASHPTEGKELTPETKHKIGRAVYEKNLTISEKERQRRIDKKREIWYTLSEETRKDYLKKSHKSIRRSAAEGSKFEEMIVAALSMSGYKIQVHHRLDFAESELNVDLFLPMEGIAIEIDGPCHFEPIFGEEALENQIERDLRKNNLLIANGYSLIRVKNPRGYTSMPFMEDFITKFLPYLKQVENQPNNGLFNIHVEDKQFSI